MLTRNILISGLKCYGCNEDLGETALKYYEEFEGLCEDCYNTSMNTAYDDIDWEIE